MNKKLPIYKLKIKEDDGSQSQVDFVALVDDPAIQLGWQMFNRKVRFTSDPQRKLITGAFMVADMPIYRRDEKMGEYYIIFDKEEIYKIVQKFFRKGFTSQFNIMHDPNQIADGVYLIESFIVDETRGISAPEGFKDISQGSWLATVKVDNQAIWDSFIKTGELKGFSVEGMFNYSPLDSNADENTINEIADIVKGE